MPEQSNLDGWYIVEIFGHQKFAGYCTIVPVGSEAFVRIDVPAIAERTRVTKQGEYLNFGYAPPGSTVKEGATQAYTKLFGPKAVYSMTPCTQEACLAAVEELQTRPLMLVSLPADKALGSAREVADGDSTDDSDLCLGCSKPLELCECPI